MMYELERRLRNISDYLVADYDYEDAKENYEYLLNDSKEHGQEDYPELKEMYEVLIELYERRLTAVERLRL